MGRSARQLAKQIVLQDAPDGPESIFPIDFFALGKCASVVRDTYFVYANSRDSCKFGGNLRFNPKAIFFKPKVLHQVTLKHLVACFHICQVEVSEQVRDESENFIADAVPEKQDSVRVPTHETASVNNVRAAFNNGFEQQIIFFRVVFQVGILNKNDLTSCLLEAPSDCGSLALVARL
jgi:hypothetical protein